MPELADHPDYQTLPPSPRASLAQQALAWLQEAEVFPVATLYRDPHGRFYRVSFTAGARWLAPNGDTAPLFTGEIDIYSVGYIRLGYRAFLPGLPDLDSRLYASIEEALTFLDCVCDNDPQSALAIPLRQPSPRGRKRNLGKMAGA